MKSKYVIALGVVLVALFFSLPYSAQAQGKDKIRIGFSISLTGSYAAGATDQMRAQELWLEKVNKKGGIFVKEFNKKLPVEFVYYDDKSEMATSVKIYEKLMTEDKVDLLLTPFSTTIVFAVIPIAEKYKIPMLGATASSIKIREMNTKYFWFITPTQPDKLMKSLVDFLKASQIKTAAVTYVQDLYQLENLQFLRPYLKDAGINMSLLKDYQFGTKDLTPLLSEVKANNPDAYISLNAYAETILVAKQSKEVNIQPKIFFSLLGPAGDFYTKVLGPTADGIMTMGQWNPKIKWAGAKEFHDDFVAKFNKKPNYLDSILPYQECEILEQAVTKAGSLNFEKTREVIEKEEFTTAGGPVKFTGRENYRTPAMIDQLQGSEHEIVWPPEFATAKPIIPKPAWK
jgi:branched-chain amino acid transport system substrate-binding protein